MKIYAYAFANTATESFVIPEQVSLLGDGIFEECEDLTEVKMPEHVAKLNFYKDLDYEGDGCYSEDVESEEQLLKSVFRRTPWLRSRGYSDDEEE